MGKKLTGKWGFEGKIYCRLPEKWLRTTRKMEQIWSEWVEFSIMHSINHMHLLLYIAYRTAYLKAQLSNGLMAANLTRNKDDIDEVSKFMDESESWESMYWDDVNESDFTFCQTKK
jgi:DNA polymerase-3 subunit alpha